MKLLNVKETNGNGLSNFLAMHGKLVAFITGSATVTTVLITLGIKIGTKDSELGSFKKDTSKTLTEINTTLKQLVKTVKTDSSANAKTRESVDHLSGKVEVVITNYSDHLKKANALEQVISLQKELLNEVKKNDNSGSIQ